MIFISF